MKRNVQFLIQKRDGRSEWLRASKIARSLQRACEAAGVPDCDVFDLTAKVMRDLSTRATIAAPSSGDRSTAGSGGSSAPGSGAAESIALTADAVAASVTRVLYASGLTTAATCYVVAARERSARKQVLAKLREERDASTSTPGGEDSHSIRFASAATRDVSRPTFFERN
ncbi:MAG: hypothetical protein AB7I19_02310 [Planctomycetota bacterium]